jgi:RNA polymerase sigma factor (sigma-70 family)
VTDELLTAFEEQRGRLLAVAYRMLGSMTEADDAVQEAWLKVDRSDTATVENRDAWLTTVVARVCLDMLRARRARREDYAGSWLPEPIVVTDDADDPERAALLADSVGLALLVVLETLTPAERLAFVLHDMFGVPFDDIAPVVARSPAAARQRASRARRRVRGATPGREPDQARQRELVDAFVAASQAGDFEALVAVLHPDVVFRIDSGDLPGRSRPPVEGPAAVAERVLAQGRPFAGFARPALVNGAPGVMIVPRDRVVAVAAFTVAEDRIVAIDLVIDPEKLRHLAPKP